MDIVARLLLREEIDALEDELSIEMAEDNPDLVRVQALRQEIDRLEHRIAASRRAESESKVVG